VLKWIQEKDVCAETLTEFLVNSSDTFMKKQGIKPVLTQKTSVKKAFTLTELLVSMAVLGLIATLTLPHMFMSADRAKKRAVFKEAYQALAQATHAAMMEGVADSRGIIPYFNAQKVCLNNSLTEGCIKDPLVYLSQARQQGVLLHSGVSIVGFNHGNSGNPGIRSDDTVVIALEDFPKKEYFRINTSVMDKTNVGRVISASDGTVQTVIDVRPGEIKCLEQACFDMFKND
jgi:prepilin-type N-terminal cleavage/methylation domain-containing protein